MPDSPLRDRWQPTRGGLINLFKYENQVFRYENGHLLLRGNNGSGKSRVLALQLPFLFDGEMSPYRVEPDRDPAKRMEWHLLMDRHERRSGYTWIEFGRVEDGGELYLTLGCGMEARKGGGSPNRWFFITSQRVGHDLDLIEARTPLTKRQLGAALVGHGQLYERSGEYRSAVDDHLFKLGTRYAPLIDLLIQLRQPQLMRDMKEDVLSNALSEALPPVSGPIINQVAESFEGLQTDRDRTEAFQDMLNNVENFREAYRQYLAVAVRRLCEIVRTAHSQFETATKALREIDQRIAETRSALASAKSRREEIATRLSTLETEIATLRDSPEMRSKRELESAEHHATDCEAEERSARIEFEKASKSHQAAIAERESRGQTVQRCREEAGKRHLALAEFYQIVAADGGGFFDWELSDLKTEQGRIDDLIGRRKKSVRHLREENEKIAAAHRNHQRDLERRDAAQASVAEAAERVTASGSALSREIEVFGRAADIWINGLKVLNFPAVRDWAEALGYWLDGREGEFSFHAELGKHRDSTQGILSNESASISAERESLKTVRFQVAAELDGLKSGHQPEPPPRHTRAIRPDDRAGAPFWKCFDFRDVIPDGERAGWEAALESAGILDAWIFPDGKVQPLHDDDFLTAGTPLDPASSLSSILRTDSAPLDRLLRCIGNHRDSAPCWVDRDGNWANGPHRGHWTKAGAEYLGHDARENSRQRRIAELEAELAGIDATLLGLKARGEVIGRQMEALDDEVKAAPATRAAEDIAVGLEGQREFLQGQKVRLIEADTKAITSGKTWQECVGHRDADAADMGLSDWAEPMALENFEAELRNFEVGTLKLWPAWQNFLSANSELDLAGEREKSASGSLDLSRRKHEERKNLARQMRAKADILLASVGASVQELMGRLKAAESGAVAAGVELEKARNAVGESEKDEARLEERLTAAKEKRGGEEDRRNHAVGRMKTFAGEQLFGEINPEYQPDRTDFSPTAAVDLARRIEQELKDHRHDDDHWNRLQSEIAQRFNELSDQLGRQGHHPSLRSVDESSVHVIRCDFRGKGRTLRQLNDLVSAELEDRKRIFEEREREVIENHLIGEAADELQKRIRYGEEWVVGVNEELERVSTSSGIRLKFAWNIADADDETLRSVRGLFLKTSAAWTPREREDIGTFLQSRIRATREEDDTASWREQLDRALDYRSWHRFGILRRGEGDSAWKKLTKQTFGTGSGGEKAMTLTVPQFAAAAAHYKSAHPHAPRLILLDEVFVGIDSATRRQLMGLLETFDLDYVMTSEREWGVYPTVSALAIYQLATRKDLNAISVTRWVWNGCEKIRDDRDE